MGLHKKGNQVNLIDFGCVLTGFLAFLGVFDLILGVFDLIWGAFEPF
jgi:hypothetical protein